VAILTGLLISLVIPPPATLLGSSELATLVSVVPGVVVAGLIVGARSVRRWLIVVLLTAGVALAIITLIGLFIPF
jgi:hypothetical protein